MGWAAPSKDGTEKEISEMATPGNAREDAERKYILDNQVRGQCIRRTEKENGKEKGRKGEEQKRKVDPRQSSGARMRG
jgi:hypothetical protein